MIQLQIPVDKLSTQIPRGVQYPLSLSRLPPGVLEPVCTGGRYGVHSHITEGLEGRQSMILRTVLQRPVMILLRHLLFENLADRVELSVSS